MNMNEETVRRLRGLIVFTVAVVVVGVNYQKLFAAAGALLKMLAPFLLGGAIAFALNVPLQATGLFDSCHCWGCWRSGCGDGIGSPGAVSNHYDTGAEYSAVFC